MKNKQYDLISIGAHPDDVEVGTGGVLIDAAKRGYKCGIIILTEGEMGTGGNSAIRAQEIKDAAGILGVDILKTFDWGDTRLEDNYEHRLELGQVVRDCKPRLILAPYPHVGHGRRQSHPDHVASGLLAINSTHLASLKKAKMEGDPHLVERIFHYFLPPGITPNFVIDITTHFDQWIKALSAHKSQFLNPEKSKDYLESISAMARSFGQQSRCKYGQGFYAVEPILVADIMTLSDIDREEDHKTLV
jgi:N-acetylglucosamine malate deacetylase 1